MPPAKKPAARGGRSTSKSNAATAPINRQEVEAATRQFEAKLEEAAAQLTTMRRDLGKNARTAYQDVADRLKKLRTDARSTNRSVLKELEKLASALAAAAPGTGTTTKASNGRATAKRTTSASGRSTAKRATAAGGRKASTSARGGAKASGAAKTTASRSRAASGSKSTASKPAGKSTAKAAGTRAKSSTGAKRSTSGKSSTSAKSSGRTASGSRTRSS